MAVAIFTNLSDRQAQVLLQWFSGEGEQNCEEWFNNQGVVAPLTKGGQYFETLRTHRVTIDGQQETAFIIECE